MDKVISFCDAIHMSEPKVLCMGKEAICKDDLINCCTYLCSYEPERIIPHHPQLTILKISLC